LLVSHKGKSPLTITKALNRKEYFNKKTMKLKIITGIFFALLDLAFWIWAFTHSYINQIPIGEGMIIFQFLHPVASIVLNLLTIPLILINLIVSISLPDMFYIISLALLGIIQYFLIGYLVGFTIQKYQ